MKEDWTKQMAKLAAKHRSKAPDGLLDDVRREMERRGLSVEKPQPARTVPMWNYRRTAVAVAATALVIAIPLTWKAVQHQTDAPTQLASNSARNHTADGHMQETGAQPATPTAGHGLLASANNQPALRPTTIAVVRAHETAQPSASTPGEPSAESNAPVANTPTEKDTQEQPTPTATKPLKQRRPTINHSYDNSYDSNDLAMNQRHEPTLSVGAFYGAGSSEGNVGNADYGVMSDAVFDSNNYAMVLGYAQEPVKTEAHHNMPIKAGVSVAYRLSPKWGVQTGLTYSYLSSDITTSYINYSVVKKQRLHYIGIPLTASYTVVGNKHWTAYITAGGMAEKLVKGQSKDNNSDEVSDVKEHRLQWSVKAAAGASYHITPIISVYAEPGVSHYFNNHSGVVNVYKDRSTTFTLDMGVRVDINK